MRKARNYVCRSLLLLIFIVMTGCIGSSSDSNNGGNASDDSDSSSFGVSGAGLSLFPNDFRSGATGSPNLPKP